MNSPQKISVLGIVGSLRGDSHNARLMEVARQALPADAVSVVWDDLRNLPHYDEDLDAGDPGAVAADLRAAIAAADVLLFATPEYNGTIPGALKNVVDWASRPAGDGALKGKPVAVVGASPGQFGGVWAQADLRKALGIAGARVVDVEFAVAKSTDAFAVEGGEAALADIEATSKLAELLETLVEEGRKNRAAHAAKELAQAA